MTWVSSAPARLYDRTDRWLHEAFPVDAAGLALLRIFVAGAILLLFVPQPGFLAGLPDSLVVGPPGPLRWLGGTPSAGALTALQVAFVVAAFAMLVGWRTPWASAAVGVLGMTLNGLTFTLGKIDHSFLIWLVPLVMAASGWGSRLSLDRRRGSGPVVSAVPTALLAVCLGLTFFTGMAPKLLSGWLEPSSQAVRYQTFRYFFGDPTVAPLAEVAVSTTSPALWELLDWATIVLEGGFLVVLLFPVLFRLWLGLAATFHLGVYLVIGIPFVDNLLLYAVFLPWGALAVRAGVSRRASGLAQGPSSAEGRPSRTVAQVPGWALACIGVAVVAAVVPLDAAPVPALVSGLGGDPVVVQVALLVVAALIGALTMLVVSLRLTSRPWRQEPDPDRPSGRGPSSTRGAGPRRSTPTP